MLKHRTFIFVLSFLLVSIPVVLSAATQRGIVPVPIKDKSGNQVLLYQESHALLVGVSEYTGGWPNLPGVQKDINKVKVALEQKGFHTIEIINPTRVELRDSIENFINQYGQDVDNRLIFYFAGHGYTLKLSYGEEMGYFVPSDAPNPNMDKSGFLATSLNMESIEVYSKQVQSKHALFLFDSCFSGSIFSLSRAIPENISFKTSKPVRQFITAGSANETVPDVSIFNDQFIRALNGEGDLDGNGYLTGVELGEFLQKTVINYSKGSQHPQYGKIRNPNLDKGDFVFSLLNREYIEQSVDSIIREREKLEQDRLNLEEERKRVVALERLKEEKRKLEEEKRRFKEELDQLTRLGKVYAGKNRNNKAQAALEKAIRLNPKDAESHYQLGKLVSGERKWRRAQSLLSIAITLDPRHGAAYYELGVVLLGRGNVDLAKDNFKKALDLEPKNLDYIMGLAMALYEKKDLDSALEMLLPVSRKETNNPKIHIAICKVYTRKGYFTAAMGYCEKALNLKADNFEAMNRLAWLYAKKSTNLQKAFELSNKTLKAFPKRPEYIDTLSEIFYVQGETEKAVEKIKEAIKLMPNNPYYKQQLWKFKNISPNSQP